MNHPYSNSKEWIPYAVSQYKLGHAKELVLLIKMDVSTKWWRSISTYPFLAINKRLKFGDGKGAAHFQSAIVYLGDRLGKFRRIFGKYGTSICQLFKGTLVVESCCRSAILIVGKQKRHHTLLF